LVLWHVGCWIILGNKNGHVRYGTIRLELRMHVYDSFNTVRFRTIFVVLMGKWGYLYYTSIRYRTVPYILTRKIDGTVFCCEKQVCNPTVCKFS
jgi:hypothetical protein